MKYETSTTYHTNSIRRESHPVTLQSHVGVPLECGLFMALAVGLIAYRLGADDALLLASLVGMGTFFAVLVAIFRYGGVIEETFGVDLNGDGQVGRVEHVMRFDVGLPGMDEHGPQRMLGEFALHPEQVAEQFRVAMADDRRGGRHGVLAFNRSQLTRPDWEAFMDRLRLHELVVLDVDNHHQLTDKGRLFMREWLAEYARGVHA